MATPDDERGAGEWWRLMYWTSHEYENEIANLNEQIFALQETIRTMADKHTDELAILRESRDMAHELADKQRAQIALLESEIRDAWRVIGSRSVVV